MHFNLKLPLKSLNRILEVISPNKPTSLDIYQELSQRTIEMCVFLNKSFIKKDVLVSFIPGTAVNIAGLWQLKDFRLNVTGKTMENFLEVVEEIIITIQEEV